MNRQSASNIEEISVRETSNGIIADIRWDLEEER